MEIIVDSTTGESVFCERGVHQVGDFRVSSTGVSVKCPSIDQYCTSSKPFECEFGAYDDELDCCICDPGMAGIHCDELDNCIITYNQKEIDDLLPGQKSCSQRERLCGMHHGVQHVHDGATVYPPPVPGPHTNLNDAETCDSGTSLKSWSDLWTILQQIPGIIWHNVIIPLWNKLRNLF